MEHTTKLMLEIQESYAKDIREIVLPLGHPARAAKQKPEVMVRMSANEVKLELPKEEDEGGKSSRKPDEPSVVESEPESQVHSACASVMHW